MRSELAKKIFDGKSAGLSENIAVCAAAALSGTFYGYEYYCEESFHLHSAVSLVITVLIAAVWFVCALNSGAAGKIGFAVFTFLYWSVPYFYTIFYASRDNVREYSKWLSMLQKIAYAMLYAPFEEAAYRTGASPELFAALLIAGSAVFFAAGYIIKRSSGFSGTGVDDNNTVKEES